MTQITDSSGRRVAELLTHLTRMTYGNGFVENLTPAQWTALRYFSRANRFSRTPSAFAEFHGTTRGTASQTIKSLIAKRYLVQKRSKTDGRRILIEFTDKASEALSNDPFETLVEAVGALPPSARGLLTNALERILGYVALERAKRPFGTCTSCEHLLGDGCCQEGQPPYECFFYDEPLAAAELELLCINYEPGKASAMKRTFKGGGPHLAS